MERKHVVTVLAALAAAACNPKSPEQQEPSSQTQTAVASERPVAKATPEAEPEPPPSLPALEGAHFSVYDLLANRPFAHALEVGEDTATVFVDASTPDFVRYVHGNHAGHWKLDVELEGRRAAAISKRRNAQVWVPGTQAKSGVIEASVFSAARGANTLTVEINGKKLEPVSLSEGWQTIRVEVPQGALRFENSLELDFSNMGRIDGNLSGGALAWLRIGAASKKVELESPPKDEPSDEAAGAAAGDAAAAGGHDSANEAEPTPQKDPAPSAPHLPAAQGAFSLKQGQGAAWYVWPLKDSKLALTLAGAPGCGLAVVAHTENSGSVVEALAEERILLEGAGERQETFVDLSKLSERVVRLELRTAGTCAEALDVERAQLVIPGEKPEVPRVEPPRYVLIWLIDTLRADYLPIHFETDVQAPNLARLAREGASFEVAYVQGNESRTSHASLFSGMYPSKHRVLGRGHLKPFHHLLPEAMKDAGYRTGAYISNGYVSKPWGFVQGWDMYLNNLRENYRIDGRSMAEMGAKWALEHKDEPFFLYLGTIDPHVTYRRHDELIGLYDKEPYNGRFNRYCSGEDLGKIKGGGLKVDERDQVRIRNLYKNEITFNDQAFGELRAKLEEAGIWEQTMVVVTSDHGDEFWEHGSVGHGHSVHQDLVHVPLIMHYPPLIPAGTVVRAGVDVLDVYPTILDAVGKERPQELQGKSLLPLVHGVSGDYPEPAIATQYLMHYGMQMRQWKLYLKRGDYQLYDRASDPLELTDVAAEHPLASRWLMDAMGWFRAHRKRWDKQAWGVPGNVAPNFLDAISADESEDD